MAEEIISCKGLPQRGVDRCQYDSAWFCQHPLCKSTVLTSTMPGVVSPGCPILCPWNRKKENE